MNMTEAQKIILTRGDLKKMGIQVSNTSLLRWEQLGRFPRRIRMAGTSIGWMSDEVAAWFRDRAEERAHHHYADYA